MPAGGRLNTRATWLLALALGLVACLAVSYVGGAPRAFADEYREGDLFVSVGGGIIRHFDADGNEIEDLDTETASPEIGDMCFDEGGMYSMNFQDGSVSRFDSSGALVESRWATGLSGSPESCVLDEDGDLYVGQETDGRGGDLQKLDADGNIVETYNPEIDLSGVDQIDLAGDQCTMLYTSETGVIKAFDVCENEQLPDFADGLGDNCNNLRIRPNGEVLVACDNSVVRVSPSGDIIQTYEPDLTDGGAGGLFALNLDNDGEHFYTATYTAGLVWRIDIESGDGVEEPYIQTVIEGDSIGGLAIFGELTVAAPVVLGATDRPSIVRSVPDPTDISTEPDVVGTNVTLAIIVAIVVLLSSQIFNETVEENNEQIERFARRYVRPLLSPLRALRGAWRSALSGNAEFARYASIAVVLVATAVVYGFLEPGFKLDSDGVLLVLSVVVALATVTYVYSGVEARVTERRYETPAGVRVYPVAMAIAIVSVLLSRLISFQPGVIYGFVASNVVLGATDLAPKQKGHAVLIAAVALLGAFLVAWGLLVPFREWAESDDNFVAVLLEASAVLVVVGAIETLAFSFVPIEFTHGIKVWRYNKAVWFVMAVAIVFLFWHVLLVQDEAGFEAVGRQDTLAALAAVGVCVGLTAAVWGFFYWRKRQALAGAPAPAAAYVDDGMTPPPNPPAQP